MDKALLRNKIRQTMREYSPQQREALSFPIVEKLLSHPMVRSANCIILFHSLPDEVYTHSLIDTLYEQGKCILLPKVVSPTEMTLHEYLGQSSLAQGAYGIWEPQTPNLTPQISHLNPTLSIIPGVAFDKHGNRLGRGKGYYDRFLSSLQTTETGNTLYKIGVCFPFQLLDNIPHDEHDISMNEIIS